MNFGTKTFSYSNSSLESRHLLYLQLRKSILESHILCNDEELISLGGLALQSEIGDFTESVSVRCTDSMHYVAGKFG